MPEEVLANISPYLDNQSKRRFSQTSIWIREIVNGFGNVKYKLIEVASIYLDQDNIRSRMADRCVCVILFDRGDVINLSGFENVQEIKLNYYNNVIDVSPLRNCKYVDIWECGCIERRKQP